MRITPSHTVLITGVSGTLGWNLAVRLAHECRVVGTFCSHQVWPEHVEAIRLDLSDLSSIRNRIAAIKPRIVVHLAGLTHPDVCEENPDLAFSVNKVATHEIAIVAGTLGAKLVFASTDLVFDGAKGNYTEDDEVRPLSVYGKSKLEAEEAVLELNKDAFVFRTSLIYGVGSPVSSTFLTALLGHLNDSRPMRVFTDQRRSPIWVEDLVEAIVLGIRKDIAGLYHIAGREVLTRYQFAELVCEAFSLRKELLIPISMSEFDYLAPRPFDSSLDGRRFESATGFTATPTHVALKKLAERITH